MLAQAAAHGRSPALVQGSALALPFAAERFDAVVCTEAFHWFPNPHVALAEFRRVLAPGGRIFVSFVNPPIALMGEVGGLVSRWLGEPARWPTRGELRRQVESEGFQVESQRIVLRLPATLILPSVLTIARRPRAAGADPAGAGDGL
jgi:SAM-dependent methyltransferase